MANFDDINSSLDEQNKKRQLEAERAAQLEAASKNTDKIVKASKETNKGLKEVKGNVTITNPDLAKSQDVNQAVEAINKLNLTTFMQNEGLPQLAKNLSDLSSKTQDLQDKLQNDGLNKMSDQLGVVVKKLDEVSKTLSKTEVSVDAKLQKTIDNLGKSIDKIDFNPTVNISAPDTKVIATPVDFKPVLAALSKVEKAITSVEVPDNSVDLSPVTSGLSAVQNAITALRFPVPNYVLPFVSATGKATQVKLGDDGSLPITASISTGGLATSVKQSDGSQKTQVVDGSGNVIGATSNALDVNIKSGSSAGTQYTEDAAAAADPVGTAVNLVRKDTPSATVSTDGDNIAQRGTNFGAAYVTLLDASGNAVSVGGGTQYAEDSAAVSGEQLTMAGVVRNDTRSTLVSTDGDRTELQVNASGDVRVDGSAVTQPVSLATNTPTLQSGSTTAVTQATGSNLHTVIDSGTVSTITNVVHVDDNAGSLTVDNGGTFAVQATLAAGATSIGKAEDVASADGDVGVPSLAVRKATPANTSGTDGDYEFLQMSAGRLWVDASGKTLTVDGSGVTQPVSLATNTPTLATSTNSIGKISDITTSVVPGVAATNLGKAEDAAHSSGDTGVMALAVRNDAGTALAGTDGDYIPISTDNSGAVRVAGSFSSTPPSDVAPATQNITTVDVASTTTTMANNQAFIIGTPTAGSAGSFALSTIETVRVEVTGIWTGTLATETSIDGGTTWVAQGVHQGAYTTSSFTTGFVGGCNVSGATNFRVRATATITGTAVIKIIESVNTQSVYIANAAPSGTIVSALNSSSATLTSGSVYTGTSEDVTNFSEMRVSVFSDVASATDGLSLQQSSNGTNWDITDTYTVSLSAAGGGKTYVVPRQARFFRVVYTNGGTNQASFRLQTILNRTATAPSSQRPSDAYTNETDLVQNQAFLMGYNGATWDRIRTIGTGVLSASAVLTAGSAIIGKVGIDQTTPGTTNLVALAANQSVNVAQINGVTPLMGNGTTGTGSQRVTIASDNTAFAVNSTLSAETTKVIGTVNQGTSPWVTSLTSTTITSEIPGTGATNLGKAEDAAHTSGDTGVMSLGVANEALTNISGTDADYTPIGTDRNGTVHVAQKASTATLANVSGSATSVTLLAANAARIGAEITNDSSALLYIKFGTTASTTSYTVVLAGAASAPFSYYEIPAGYTGRIDGIWASATGNARTTEITP